MMATQAAAPDCRGTTQRGEIDGDAGLCPQTRPAARWPFTATIRSEVVLHSSPAAIWALLVDFEGYALWNPFTPRVHARLEEGAPVVLEVHGLASRPMRRVERMHSIVAPRRLCWSMTMGPLLAANRSQWVIPLDGEHTLYRTDDALSGPLTPLVMRGYGRAMQAGFDGVCAGLERALGGTGCAG